MPSLVASCATGPLVEFGGRFLRVHPRTIGNIAEIKAQIMHLRGDPMTLLRYLVSAAPEKCKEEVALQCLRTVRHKWCDVSAADMNEFLRTPEGILLTTFQAFAANGVDYEWVRAQACDLLDSEGDGWYYDLMWRVKMASGDLEIFDLCSIRNLVEYEIDEEWDRYGGDQGIISMLGNKPFFFHPDQVLGMTYTQVRMLCAGSDGPQDDDRQVEATEFAHPVDRKHKRLMEQEWASRYTRLVRNITDGKSLLDGLEH